ncbi:MAG TPA: serine/threonine-protein kinase [Kofleriaceae bacterium]|nr:serine/threonine-protein kinase [Kofleriaceae bacterium]
MRSPNTECLDPETFAAYLDGVLGHDAVARADRHIDHCTACRGELSALAAMHTFTTASFAEGSGEAMLVVDGAPLASRLGRYELIRELGRGSMGVVVRAYDPELARAVAVKILSPRLWHGAEPDAQDRLRREAQAMARLVHPNVVTVYDVATDHGALFVAMELVEGGTLRDYVLRPRPWRDTLDVCIRAGRGLAAAHAAKLIHRDYKPENVLCGTHGRVVVSDFGLARLEDDHPVARSAPATATTLAGTPAYMAPELFRGEPATTASDQFAFCVATFEALYGVRPFAGDTFAQLREQILAGIPRAATTGRGIPLRVHGVLLRGLAVDPAHRWSSLPELLDALDAAATSRTRRTALAALAFAFGALVLGNSLVTRLCAAAPACALAAIVIEALLAQGTVAGIRARVTAWLPRRRR